MSRFRGLLAGRRSQVAGRWLVPCLPVVVVAVTGGIGSGKSTVAGLLAARGAAVVDADKIARQVVAPGGPSYRSVVEHFGPAVVAADGTLDRAALAARVFADPAELAVLNAVTHPAIGGTLLTRLADLSRSRQPVVLDIPLLTNATRELYGLAGVVVVDAPVEVAVRRLVEQRGLTEADAVARVRAQISREERIRLADVVIDNSGSRDSLAAAVEGVWEWLEGLFPGSSGGPSVDGSSHEAFDADGGEGS
jgi:dephospho-CoA kinase